MSKTNCSDRLEEFYYDDDNDTFVSFDNTVKRESCVQKYLFRGKYKTFYYPTNMTPGFNIYNAVTGIKYDNYTVGNDPYFKVLVLGEHLYYDSPNQYENHFNTKLNRIIKQQWLEKKE